MLQIFKSEELNEMLHKEYCNVVLVESHSEVVRVISTPKSTIEGIKCKVGWALCRNLKKFDYGLNGIVIGYRNIMLLVDGDATNNEMLPLHNSVLYNVVADFYVFRPEVGNYLKAFIKTKYENHMECVIHRFFKVKISRPFELDDNAWTCSDLDVGKEILFKVTAVHFNGYRNKIKGCINPSDYIDPLKITDDDDYGDGDDDDDDSDSNTLIINVVEDNENADDDFEFEEDDEYDTTEDRECKIGVENSQASREQNEALDLSMNSFIQGTNKSASEGMGKRECIIGNESRRTIMKMNNLDRVGPEYDEEILVVEIFEDDDKENDMPLEN